MLFTPQVLLLTGEKMEVASNYAYGGGAPAGTVAVDLDADFDPKTDIAWDQDAEDVSFAAIGNYQWSFAGGKDYGGASSIDGTNALKVNVGDLSSWLRSPC